MKYDMVVLGDIGLDWCVDSTLSVSFTDINQDIDEHITLNELPGGTGLNFARYAKEEGFTPLLLGKVGNDPAGNYLRQWLTQNGLNEGVDVETFASTLKVFIAHDNLGRRLLVADRNNANKHLSENDVLHYEHVLSSCKLVYISGTCLTDRNAPRLKAVKKAITLARSAKGAKIVFDVVPHDLFKIYSDVTWLVNFIQEMDIIVSQMATIRRLLGLGKAGELVSRNIAEETIEAFSNYSDSFVFYFGDRNANWQVSYNGQKNQVLWEETDFVAATDKRGYGDRIALRALRKGFGIEPRKS
jgi:sugar/nucleoside kinase (ribokinase family)